jgi:hypothetical protein
VLILSVDFESRAKAVIHLIKSDPISDQRPAKMFKGTSINSISTAAGYKKLSHRWAQLRYFSE